jgi:hypothetical protein
MRWCVRVFQRLMSLAKNFDVIMLDPPWRLATSQPTRGVALGYNQVRARVAVRHALRTPRHCARAAVRPGDRRHTRGAAVE